MFANSGPVRPGPNNTLTPLAGQQSWLHGPIHGHFDEKWTESDTTGVRFERMNEGIAIVPPAWHILEVVEQPGFLAERNGQGSN